MVGPSMRPPRSISGSSSAAAAAAVAMAMATVANARLAGACVGPNAGIGNGAYHFEGGSLDQDGNPVSPFRPSHADDRNRMANPNTKMEDYQSMGMFNPVWATRPSISTRGTEATSACPAEIPISSHNHRKLHAYLPLSPTIPSSSRGVLPLASPSIYSPNDPLAGHARTQKSPPLTIAASNRYISAPTPGAHEMVSDPKRLGGFDYFNLPLSQHSTASTPSVTSPSFTAHTRGFSQLSLLDDTSLSASLPPTPTQSTFEKYYCGPSEGLGSNFYKASVPLYPSQTSQPSHRFSGQSTTAISGQHKQLRLTSISPHPQVGRDARHQSFGGLPDRRSSLPWDARISSHSGPSLDGRVGSKGSSRQPPSFIPSPAHGYKNRERNNLPQALLVRSNSTPAIFGLPSASAPTLEQQQQYQAHFSSQGWQPLRPKVENNCCPTTDPSHSNGHSQGQITQQDFIQENGRPSSLASSGGSSSNSLTSRQQHQYEHQIHAQRNFSQTETSFHHQHPEIGTIDRSSMPSKDHLYFGSSEAQQTNSAFRASSGSISHQQDMTPVLPCSYSSSETGQTHHHRPISHSLTNDCLNHSGRNDAFSSQQQQNHTTQLQPQSSQHESQHHPHHCYQNTSQHPLSLRVEELDDETFDSSLAMVLDDHLSLMDHLNMMPDVEVYQDQVTSATAESIIRPSVDQHSLQQQNQQHPPQTQKITVSTNIHSQHQHPRYQAPMSAPAVSSHQGLFCSNGYTDSSNATSVPSPTSPVNSAMNNGDMVTIKQEFGNPRQQAHPQQQQPSMLYFDNSALVLNDGPQSAPISNGNGSIPAAGDGNNNSNDSFGYVQDTSFMHVKAEPDLDLNHQHMFQQQHHHHQHHQTSPQQQQQHQQHIPSASVHYIMDRQHPFDVTPIPVQNQHQHYLQSSRLNQSTITASTTIAPTHGSPILVAEFSHRPHQQQ
ncbi:hypothetical protein FBU30_002423 [Linnemannia zychae]|nr:hypothetical protein FBU30_002423 [Linnemannia zychae]